MHRSTLAALDFLVDLERFLVEIDVYTATNSIYGLDVDWGNTGTVDGAEIYKGNGIPDVAEIALLQAVMKNIYFNRTHKGGAASSHSWKDFYANQQIVAAALPAESDAVVNTVTAYFTLGNYGHMKRMKKLVLTEFGVELELMDFHINAANIRWPERDLDGDMAFNGEEWELTPATGPEPNAQRVADFVEHALDPEWPADWSPGDGFSAKSLPNAGMSKQVAEPECPCVGTATVRLEGSVYSTPAGRYDGGSLVVGQDIAVPLGSEVRLWLASSAGGRFMRWSAPDTLIDGSPSSSVTFVVNGDITVTPLDRHDVYQRVWSSATEWVDHGPFLWGVPATLESPGTGFESDASGYDGFSNTATVQVVPGTLDADLRARYGSGGEVSHHVVWNGGGYGVIAVRGLYTLMDEQAASFLGVASFSAWGNGRAVAIPDIGYTYVDRAVPFGFYDEPASVALEFVSLAELKLKVDVEGEGGPPQCAGYITADGAKAYFGGFSLVKLEAVPQPGYVFSHWQGRGTAFVADDEDDPAEERSLESEESPITTKEIWITMRDQDGLTSRDVAAVFSNGNHSMFEPEVLRPSRLAPPLTHGASPQETGQVFKPIITRGDKIYWEGEASVTDSDYEIVAAKIELQSWDEGCYTGYLAKSEYTFQNRYSTVHLRCTFDNTQNNNVSPLIIPSSVTDLRKYYLVVYLRVRHKTTAVELWDKVYQSIAKTHFDAVAVAHTPVKEDPSVAGFEEVGKSIMARWSYPYRENKPYMLSRLPGKEMIRHNTTIMELAMDDQIYNGASREEVENEYKPLELYEIPQEAREVAIQVLEFGEDSGPNDVLSYTPGGTHFYGPTLSETNSHFKRCNDLKAQGLFLPEVEVANSYFYSNSPSSWSRESVKAAYDADPDDALNW